MNKTVKNLFFLLTFLSCSVISPQYIYSASKATPCAYAHFLSAQLEKIKGNYEKAVFEYEKALECDQSSFYLRKELITLLISQNKIDAAKDLLEETLKRFPDKDDLRLILAHIYKNEGKTRNAARIVERVLKANPENQNGNYLLFTVFLEDKKWESAEKYAQKIVELAKTDKSDELHKVYFLLGMEYARADNFSEGIKYLKEARALSPDNPEIHAALGAFYEADENLDEALKKYKKALELAPLSIALYHKLGDIYSRLGKEDEAISIYEKALQMYAGDYVSATSLAQIYYRRSKYNEGLKLLQNCPIRDANVYYLLGTFLVRLKRMNEAEENLKKAVSLLPGSYAPYLMLIHIYGKQDRRSEAFDLLNNALEKSLLKKNRIDLLFGIAHLQFKNYNEAINYLRKAHNLNPDDDFILFQLGAAYEQNKDWFRAVYHLRKTIKMNPQNAEALNYLGYMFAEEGTNLNEAMFLIEKALELDPANGYFVDSLGWVYYQKGLLDKALAELNRAIELLKAEGEDDAIIREHLGDVYYEKGEFLKAKEQWAISISIEPEREEVKEKLKRLK